MGIAAVRANRGLRWLAVAYPVAMGLTLVYLGECHVGDVLAGAVGGYVGWRVADTLFAIGARLAHGSGWPELGRASEDTGQAA